MSRPCSDWCHVTLTWLRTLCRISTPVAKIASAPHFSLLSKRYRARGVFVQQTNYLLTKLAANTCLFSAGFYKWQPNLISYHHPLTLVFNLQVLLVERGFKDPIQGSSEDSLEVCCLALFSVWRLPQQPVKGFKLWWARRVTRAQLMFQAASAAASPSIRRSLNKLSSMQGDVAIANSCTSTRCTALSVIRYVCCNADVHMVICLRLHH